MNTPAAAPSWDPDRIARDHAEALERCGQRLIAHHRSGVAVLAAEAETQVDDLLQRTGDLADLSEASTNDLDLVRRALAQPLSADRLKVIQRSGVLHTADDRTLLAQLLAGSELTPWLAARRAPSTVEIVKLRAVLCDRIVRQRAETAQRMELSRVQESAVAHALVQAGLTRGLEAPVQLVTPAAVTVGRFTVERKLGKMKGDAFARPRAGGPLVAIEAKYCSDEVNSIKRIKEVADKSAYWRERHGSEVLTVAVVGGAVNPTELTDLQRRGVPFFWDHDLGELVSHLRRL